MFWCHQFIKVILIHKTYAYARVSQVVVTVNEKDSQLEEVIHNSILSIFHTNYIPCTIFLLSTKFIKWLLGNVL
jgi:hypothetical protein